MIPMYILVKNEIKIFNIYSCVNISSWLLIKYKGIGQTEPNFFLSIEVSIHRLRTHRLGWKLRDNVRLKKTLREDYKIAVFVCLPLQAQFPLVENMKPHGAIVALWMPRYISFVLPSMWVTRELEASENEILLGEIHRRQLAIPMKQMFQSQICKSWKVKLHYFLTL